MKGIVFTEFVEMVEQRFGPMVADRMIVDSRLASGGAYTSVGTYPHEEMVQLVGALSRLTGTALPQLLQAFGEHLAARFATLYPAFFDACDGVFDFIASVEDTIHVEVRKLYPDAELPRFEVEHRGPGTMTVVYRSARHFEDLAYGLILGSARRFGTQLDIRRERVADGGTRFALSAA